MDGAPFNDAPNARGGSGKRAAPGLAVYASAPSTVEFKKLRKRILRQTQDTIARFALDKPRADGGPQKWLVCLSGGKDSYGLLAALLDLKWQGGLKADLLACNLDQGQPGFPKHILVEYA
ncbi:MAG: hypothetical protein AAGJ87_17455, partial [Pseudomonadota bacterium]